MDAIREVAVKVLADLTEAAISVAPMLAERAMEGGCGDPECKGHERLMPPNVLLFEHTSDESITAQVFVRNYAGAEEFERAWGEVWMAVSVIHPEVLVVADECSRPSEQAKLLRDSGIDIPPEEDAGRTNAIEVAAFHRLSGVHDYEVAWAVAEYHIGDDGGVTFDEPHVEDKVPMRWAKAFAAMETQVFGPPNQNSVLAMATLLQSLGHVVVVGPGGEEG